MVLKDRKETLVIQVDLVALDLMDLLDKRVIKDQGHHLVSQVPPVYKVPQALQALQGPHQVAEWASQVRLDVLETLETMGLQGILVRQVFKEIPDQKAPVVFQVVREAQDLQVHRDLQGQVPDPVAQGLPVLQDSEVLLVTLDSTDHQDSLEHQDLEETPDEMAAEDL